ncbi:MAG TPA: type II secretion system protein GspM [Candidatus Hydrogenedentes bacterium]|nr:type II secretion system protein GspM [Candidatus Hydrogenedentota bacterium]HRK33278.1 type II secretion system protein GspM [Candidatus Hydrogenedentota bacterium]
MATSKLQPRERMVLIGGAVAVVLMGVWWLFEGPYQAYLDSGAQIVEARQRLLDAKIKQAEVRKAEARQKAILANIGQGNFDLWSQVDKAAKDLKLGTQCSIRSGRGMTARGDNSTSVEVTLTNVTSQELVDLLHRIYDTGSIVMLSQLNHLKPSMDKKGLDCRMTLVAPRA